MNFQKVLRLLILSMLQEKFFGEFLSLCINIGMEVTNISVSFFYPLVCRFFFPKYIFLFQSLYV